MPINQPSQAILKVCVTCNRFRYVEKIYDWRGRDRKPEGELGRLYEEDLKRSW